MESDCVTKTPIYYSSALVVSLSIESGHAIQTLIRGLERWSGSVERGISNDKSRS